MKYLTLEQAIAFQTISDMLMVQKVVHYNYEI